MKKRLLKFMGLLLILLAVQHPAAAQNTSLVVVGNEKGVPASLKGAELKSILMSERQRWKSGYKITLALMKTNTPVGRTTCERLYHMSDNELNKYWLGLLFQGKSNVPKTFETVEQLLSYVADNPGAIGVVDQAPTLSGVQVIAINGKRSL